MDGWMEGQTTQKHLSSNVDFVICGTKILVELVRQKYTFTFVVNRGGFILQFLKITMHQGDPGVIILNHLPALHRQKHHNRLENSQYHLSKAFKYLQYTITISVLQYG